MTKGRPRTSALFWLAAGLLGSLALARALPTADGLPDDPLAGEALFETKGCVACHGFAGESAGIGPALEAGRFGGTFLELGAALWNHAPVMSATVRRSGVAWPELTPRETTELIVFLYFIDYLGNPGSAEQGRRLFRAEGCTACHAVGRGGAGIGPDLRELSGHASPLFVAQQIWNHGPGMLRSMRDLGLRPPRFREGDVANLSAFLRQEAGSGLRAPLLTAPGNPNRGRATFSEKRCSACHGSEARGGSAGPDLSSFDLKRSAEAIAADMWNHALEMNDVMRQRGIPWPTFENSELADLVAFLYFLRFDDPPGRGRRGAEVFETHSCAGCHDGSAAPGVARLSEAARSPAALVAAMWNHAPLMREAVLSRGEPWPELSGGELRDLHAYLGSVSGQAAEPAR